MMLSCKMILSLTNTQLFYFSIKDLYWMFCVASLCELLSCMCLYTYGI